MSNFIQNLFSNPRIRLIIASIVLFIFITGIVIYLRGVITSPPKEITCPAGETYNQIQNKCLPTCPEGEINNPSNLAECIPNCSSGQTYNETLGECVFQCGANTCDPNSNSWLCVNNEFCATPNCYDSNGNMTLYCNRNQKTYNTCARDNTGNLISGASEVVQGCFTSSNTNNIIVSTSGTTGTLTKPDGTCNPGQLPSSTINNGTTITICCPTGKEAIANKASPGTAICCPTNTTNLIDGTCCPSTDSNGNPITQTFTDTNGSIVCCPASSTGLVNGKCCDNIQTYSTSSGPSQICCPQGEVTTSEGKCCSSSNTCEQGAETVCMNDNEECTLNGPCPTSQVYTKSNGNKYCCPETVTGGNCYNVCAYQPDSSILSNGKVITYYNSSGDQIKGITTDPDGFLTCGYAYQVGNTDQYLTCINNTTTKSSVCDASAMCETSLISEYKKGGVNNNNGTNYYYCYNKNNTTNYWNGESGSKLEFTYTIKPKPNASDSPSMCQNINMCQKNYPGELSITTSEITNSGESCTVTLDCENLSTITGQKPPIAPSMSPVSGATGVTSYDGSITGGSSSVNLGSNANFLSNGEYAPYGTVDGNSAAPNRISGTFCEPAPPGNTYDNNQGSTILCYNSSSWDSTTSTMNYTAKYFSNVTNGLGCDGNGFITGQYPNLKCQCTRGGPVLANNNKSCYTNNTNVLIPNIQSILPSGTKLRTIPTALTQLQILDISSTVGGDPSSTPSGTITGGETRSLIFFKVDNNQYSNWNGQYLNYYKGSILSSDSDPVNIMYISFNNVSNMTNIGDSYQGLPLLKGLLFTGVSNNTSGLDSTGLLPIITYNPTNGGSAKFDTYSFSSYHNNYIPGGGANVGVGYFLTLAEQGGNYCIAAVSAIYNNTGTYYEQDVYCLAANNSELIWIKATNLPYGTPFASPPPSNLIICNPVGSLSVDQSSTTSDDDDFFKGTISVKSINSITDSISNGNNKWSYSIILSNLYSGYEFSQNN